MANLLNNADLPQKELYQKLWDYYNNNGMYDNAQALAYKQNSEIEAIKPLRTVVNRSVEFYVSKMLSGEVTVSTNSKSVKDAIHQIWQWSNFDSQKQTFSRFLALTGNLFIKVQNDDSKVWFENVDAANVTDFSVDARGYLLTIRIDIPVVVDDKNMTHTEYWSKTDNYYSIWQHNQSSSTPLDQLGDPMEYDFLTTLGIDFIPIVLIKFRDSGKKYGDSCVYHALDKIDNANRLETRLEQLLFKHNKPVFVISSNAVDKDGSPIPAPKFKNANNEETIELKENGIIRMPGLSTINSLIPQIDYESARGIVKDMMEELESDLPELRYYSIKDGNLSGKAIRSLLGAAVDRASEARGNILQGLVRLNQMALTIGSVWGFLASIGSYESGDFEHSINCGEMFPASEEEKAATLKMYVEAGLPLPTAMRKSGFSEEEILQATIEKQADAKVMEDIKNQSLVGVMSNFNTGV